MAEAYANTDKPEENREGNTDTAEKVLAFFRHFLTNEESEKTTLPNSPDFYVEAPNRLVFSLPALHAHLYENQEVTYLKFRNSLFRSRLNEQLKHLGGCIELHESTGKVDTNLYLLIKIEN